MLREIILALGIVGFCCRGSSAVNCYSKSSMQSAQFQCFTSRGLQMNVKAEEIQNAVQNDPEIACQNNEQYKAALRCALNIARRCLIQVGQNPDIIPDVDRTIEGLNYVCNNIQNVNTQCIKNHNADMQACVVNRARAAFSGISRQDVAQITCKAFELAEECMAESLVGCPGQTKEIMVRYTGSYLTPKACGHSIPVVGGYTTMAPVEIFTLVTGMPSLPHASCYNKDSIHTAQQRCYSQEGLHVVLPEITLGNGQKTKQSYLDALMSNSRDFKSMCRNQLAEYQRAMWCAMEVARKCMPYGYKGYVPSGRQVQELLVDLCNNVDDINQGCVNSKQSDLFDCGYRKGLSLRSRDAKSLLCSAFKFNAVCQNEELRSCGCKTVRQYVKMSKKHLNPSSCPAIDVDPPECDPVTGDFVNAAPGSTVSVSLLTIGVFLAYWIFM